MTRLPTELNRLYQSPDAPGPGLPGPDGQTRSMVLELARPAGWEELSAVWRGVQADLGLPAPAIAVSGSDGLQLWFSLAQPIPGAQAQAFLLALRGRYLGHVVPDRIGTAASTPPPVERSPGRWSAFVAPDLAAVFADEPWLDMPPGHDAQADLLSRQAMAKPGEFALALERLAGADAPAATTPPPARGDSSLGARSFLLEVMRDRSIDLHLRIEAARALLPYDEGQGP